MRRGPGSILLLLSAFLIVVLAGPAAFSAGDATGPADLALPAAFRATMMILDQQLPGTVKISGTAEGPGAGTVIAVGSGTTIGVGTTGSSGVAPVPNAVGTFPNPAKGGRPTGNSAFLSMTLRRLSTDDENLKQAAALKSGGTSALVAELAKTDVGELQLDAEMPWTIRSATTWTTAEERVVRLMTTGRLLTPQRGTPPDASPIVNIVEFRLRPGERYGAGSLVSATQVDFPEPGRIVPRTLVIGSGTQRLTNVEPRPVRTQG
ncbi:MAG TPA: hypothetical protein VFQ07_13615 [Candidatus Polarisedimenticolia bacterium]|nr:hypothetical protein [Candidatus Polarisedimenticolia bacterium]